VLGPGAAVAGRSPHPVGAPWPSAKPAVHEQVRRPLALGIRAVRYARGLLGVPYRYGGDSPGSGFDCSGFVRYVFGHFGVELPHGSVADYSLGRPVARGALRPGDLVFFSGLGHVGMYVGSGRFIHAPHTGTTVRITSMDDPWYRGSYVGARRVRGS
jgi:cell wall-associated NlpC family hydrolase